MCHVETIKEQENTKKGIHSREEDNIFILYPNNEELYFFLPYYNKIIKDALILEENNHQFDRYDNIATKHSDGIHNNPQTNNSININGNIYENKETESIIESLT